MDDDETETVRYSGVRNKPISQATVEKQLHKARHGETNGKCRISDADCHSMRLERAESIPKPSWRELATRYGIHERWAKRIIYGQARTTAGGPIEPPSPPVLSHNTRGPIMYSSMIRCASCGSKAYPCRESPRQCYHCFVRNEQPWQNN